MSGPAAPDRLPAPAALPGPADAPIGVFDSSLGGLTVARAILDQLPHEPILYLGDTARAPYGPRPIAQVRRYALGCLDELVERGVKMLVIACNSASAAVLGDARERYAVPVVEVIRPAVRRAVRSTRNGRVGVLCTSATATSGAYADAFAANPDLEVVTRAAPRFVEFVEAGVTGGDELLAVAQDYLAPMKDAGVDTLVLGCTHYPLLTGVISYVMGEGVALVSSAEETAQIVYRELVSRGIARDDDAAPPEHHFLTTGDPETFSPLAQRFLGATGAAIRAEALPVTTSTGTIPRITAPLASGGTGALRAAGSRR